MVGSKTKIFVHPHIGEFDEEALFSRSMTYEQPVFCWLENNVQNRYDTIVEIGANVGVYTVFFDRLAQQANSRLTSIIAFEPSPKAFRRLSQNLNSNRVQHVLAYPVAIAEQTGFRRFYEPRGHLTNGSFSKDFARHFSDDIQISNVLTIDAASLGQIFKDGDRVLVKIDAEGYEPIILTAMEAAIRQYRPDLLIEVLKPYASDIEKLSCLSSYTKYLVQEDGLCRLDCIEASERYRDWLLVAESRDSIAERLDVRPSL